LQLRDQQEQAALSDYDALQVAKDELEANKVQLERSSEAQRSQIADLERQLGELRVQSEQQTEVHTCSANAYTASGSVLA